MLSIPVLSRTFSMLLLALGLYLAIENTLISAEVLSSATGASVVAANAIAVAATGLELIFASWIRQEETLAELWQKLRASPVNGFLRLSLAGVALSLVYHFDIFTTALHPGFSTQSTYFFSVVVGAFVFGPEACIFLSDWVWLRARDAETRRMAQSNSRDAENAFRRSERSQLVKHAALAGKDAADRKAADRWGQ